MRRISSACGGSVCGACSSKYAERGEEPTSIGSRTYSGSRRRKPVVKYHSPAVCELLEHALGLEVVGVRQVAERRPASGGPRRRRRRRRRARAPARPRGSRRRRWRIRPKSRKQTRPSAQQQVVAGVRVAGGAGARARAGRRRSGRRSRRSGRARPRRARLTTSKPAPSTKLGDEHAARRQRRVDRGDARRTGGRGRRAPTAALVLRPRSRSRAPRRSARAARPRSALTSRPGARRLSSGNSSCMLRMSVSTASATPGYWTLTATSRAVVRRRRGRPARSTRRRTASSSNVGEVRRSASRRGPARATLRIVLEGDRRRVVAQRREALLELLALALGDRGRSRRSRAPGRSSSPRPSSARAA